MDKNAEYQLQLFKEMADYEAKKIKRCRTCVHRKRYELNDFSSKVIQCCELQPSKRSNSGLKTIKVTDVACGNYSEKIK